MIPPHDRESPATGTDRDDLIGLTLRDRTLLPDSQRVVGARDRNHRQVWPSSARRDQFVRAAESVTASLDHEYWRRRDLRQPGPVPLSGGMQRERKRNNPRRPEPLRGAAGYAGPSAAPASDKWQGCADEVRECVAPGRVELSGLCGNASSRHPPGLLEPSDPETGGHHRCCQHDKIR
jgi:hypothetical protein